MIDEDELRYDCRKNKYETWLEAHGYSKETIEKLLEVDPTGMADVEYEDFRES